MRGWTIKIFGLNTVCMIRKLFFKTIESYIDWNNTSYKHLHAYGIPTYMSVYRNSERANFSKIKFIIKHGAVNNVKNIWNNIRRIKFYTIYIYVGLSPIKLNCFDISNSKCYHKLNTILSSRILQRNKVHQHGQNTIQVICKEDRHEEFFETLKKTCWIVLIVHLQSFETSSPWYWY